MKLLFCKKCNGTNVLGSTELNEAAFSQHTCQICDRTISDIGKEEIIDTRNFKILIIDDEQGFLQIMNEVMGKDYSVTLAANGRDGLNQAINIQPDLILLDVSLPDTNGYDLCRSMKLHDVTCHIPIFFVTSHDHDIEQQKGFNVGAVDYITKPVIIQVLHAKISLHLRMKQLSC